MERQNGSIELIQLMPGQQWCRCSHYRLDLEETYLLIHSGTDRAGRLLRPARACFGCLATVAEGMANSQAVIHRIALTACVTKMGTLPSGVAPVR